MITSDKKKKKNCFGINSIIVLFVLLICTKGFSYVGWNVTLGGQAIQLLLIIILLYVFVVKHFELPAGSQLKYIILCLMIVPLFSIIPARILHNQSLPDSFYNTKTNLYYVFFFVLYYLKLKEKSLLKLILILGIAWCFIEIIQQLSYPNVWFAGRHETEEKEIEVRYGVYRYDMSGREFGVLFLCYSIAGLIKNRKKKYIVGAILGLIGIYLLTTRQIIFAMFICTCYGLLSTYKVKISSIILVSLVSSILLYNGKKLFGDTFEQVSEQLYDKDNVRYLSYTYYGLTYNKDNLLPVVFGNGDPGRNTTYANEIHNMEIYYGLWRADIGIVGAYSLYGIAYVVIIILFFAFCFNKRKYIDLYLRMYILFMLITCPMLWHFSYSAERITISCCILYLIDKTIKRNEILESVDAKAKKVKPCNT